MVQMLTQSVGSPSYHIPSIGLTYVLEWRTNLPTSPLPPPPPPQKKTIKIIRSI